MEKKERFNFLNPVLAALTQVAEFNSCFLKVFEHHYATLFCQWYLPFSVQSDRYVLPFVFSTSWGKVSFCFGIHLPSLNYKVDF